MVMWDYKDTELPFNTTDRSPHMKDMGGKGWELVSVSPNPESRCFVFFWKRPQNLALENGKDFLQPDVKKTEDQNGLLEERRVHKNDLFLPLIINLIERYLIMNIKNFQIHK